MHNPFMASLFVYCAIGTGIFYLGTMSPNSPLRQRHSAFVCVVATLLFVFAWPYVLYQASKEE